MKKRRSLSKITVLVQVVLFVAVVLSILVIGMYFQKQTRREAEQSAHTRLQDDIRRLEDRLNTDAVQVREMMHTVANSKDLWSDREKQYFAKISLKASMRDKYFFYEDMALLFICEKDAFYLSNNNTSQTGRDNLSYRDYIEENIEEMGRESQGKFWIIKNIDGMDYCFFVCSYVAENTYVGVGMLCDELLTDINLFFQESEGRFLITDLQGNHYPEQVDLQGNLPAETIVIQEDAEQAGLHVNGVMQESGLKYMRRSTLVSIVLLGILCVGSVMLQYFVLRKMIVIPVTALSDEVKNIAEDSDKLSAIHIEESGSVQEVYTLQKALKYLLGEVIAAKMQLYEKKMQDQDTELRMLRAQLKPHFYLNSIMTINSMTYQNRNEDIREYLAHFSEYMRYMMRIQTNMVRLGEELTHINNYIEMQKIKFPSSVIGMIDCPEEFKNLEIPHLILYTIVENAFKYAMNLQDTLVLFISCESVDTEVFQGYKVTVEDNGPGFSENIFTVYNSERILEKNTAESYIGLSNVKRSLFLQYHRNDLLKLMNVIPHGAQIEIYIPKERQQWDLPL